MVEGPSEVELRGEPDLLRQRERLEAARKLEIFLDLVSAVAARHSYAHLLDHSFSGVLDAEQLEIRRALRQLEQTVQEHVKVSPAWAPVQRLLDAMRSPQRTR